MAQKRMGLPREDGDEDDAQPTDRTYLFRSYDHCPSNDPNLGPVLNKGFTNDLNPEVKVWEVARATTAAPTFFRQMTIGNDPYMDGGVGDNNPTALAWDNARQISRTRDHKLAVLISVGTGKFKEPTRFRHVRVLGYLPAMIKFGTKKISATEPVHQEMERVIASQGEKRTPYWRFNVDRKLGNIALDEFKVKGDGGFVKKLRRRLQRYFRHVPIDDLGGEGDDGRHGIPFLMDREAAGDALPRPGCEYETVEEIERLTREYLSREDLPELPGILPQIRDCARKLVEIARARRDADAGRWQYFIGDTYEYRDNASIALTYSSRPKQADYCG